MEQHYNNRAADLQSHDFKKVRNQIIGMQEHLAEIRRNIEREKVIGNELAKQIEAKKKEFQEIEAEKEETRRKTKEILLRSTELSNYCESTSKSNAVMRDQLHHFKNCVMEKEKELLEKRTYLKNKRNDYKQRYEIWLGQIEKHPSYAIYACTKAEIKELEETLKIKISLLKQRQADLFKLKCEKSRQKNAKAQYYPLSNFIVSIAKQKCETMRYQREIEIISKEIQSMEVSKKMEKLHSVPKVLVPVERSETINSGNIIEVITPQVTARPNVLSKWTVPKINIPKFSPRISFKPDPKRQRIIPRIKPVSYSRAHTSLVRQASIVQHQHEMEVVLPKPQENNNAVSFVTNRNPPSKVITISSPFFKNAPVSKDHGGTTMVQQIMEDDINHVFLPKVRKLNNVPPLLVDDGMVEKQANSSEAIYHSEPLVSTTDDDPISMNIAQQPLKATVELDQVITNQKTTEAKPSRSYYTPEERQSPVASPTTEYLTPRSTDITFAAVDFKSNHNSQNVDKTVSPLDIEKYKKEMKDLCVSPEFKYETRRMFDQHPPEKVNDLPSTSEEPLVCTSVDDISINYDILKSPEPVATTGSEKAMFTFGNADRKTSRSIFDIFGNAGEESTSNNFTINFGGAAKSQTETPDSFFRFKF